MATIETNRSTVFFTVSANFSSLLYIVVASQVYLDCQISILQPAEAQPAVQPGPPHRLSSATSSFSIFSPPSHRFLEPSPSRSLDRKTSPNPLTFAFLTSILIPTAAAPFSHPMPIFTSVHPTISPFVNSSLAFDPSCQGKLDNVFLQPNSCFGSKLSVLCFGPCF